MTRSSFCCYESWTGIFPHSPRCFWLTQTSALEPQTCPLLQHWLLIKNKEGTMLERCLGYSDMRFDSKRMHAVFHTHTRAHMRPCVYTYMRTYATQQMKQIHAYAIQCMHMKCIYSKRDITDGTQEMQQSKCITAYAMQQIQQHMQKGKCSTAHATQLCNLTNVSLF